MKHHLGYSEPGFKLGCEIARVLPRKLCQGLGATLALASYAANRTTRRALRRNLEIVTGNDGATLNRVCRSNFRNFGRMLADYFYCAGTGADQIRALLADWRGLEHLRAALALGKGVVLVTAHLGNWELGAALLAMNGWPIHIVTLEEPSPELTRMRDAHRRRLGIRTIALGQNPFAFVEMLGALRCNEIVCMLVDRPYADTGAAVTFFGQATKFSAAPALLWEHTGAAIVPAFVLQGEEGCYQAFVEPAVPMIRGADPQADLLENTQRIASVFEAMIEQHPDQWFNYVPIWKNETSPLPRPRAN